MTDDALRIIATLKQTPVMTLESIAGLSGLSAYTTRFILEQMLQSGVVQVRHELWEMMSDDCTDGPRREKP